MKSGIKTLASWLVILMLILLGLHTVLNNPDMQMPYSKLISSIANNEVKRIEISSDKTSAYVYFVGAEENAMPKEVTIPSVDSFMDQIAEVMKENPTLEVVQEQESIVISVLSLFSPFVIILIFVLFWLLLMNPNQGGNKSMNFGKSKARMLNANDDKTKLTFKDVAGIDEEKEELSEIVDFLRSPKKFTDMGARIPKGVLLVGPPGTGKTLLAKAVAGEAGVPFFIISGSDFVEMFVGVGASRVRDLFEQAKKNSPCLVFIDEIDAVGRHRGAGVGGGHDEREQTLNQLLVEMDGFDNEKGLIILAATNRPDILDPALLRPGRFDRQVVVDRPDVKGREAILRIHAKNVKLDKDVDFPAVAHATSGLAGADLANIVNEAALLAVRAGRKKVSMIDFNEAVEKNIIGLQKKTRVVKDEERKIVAFHETGHALVAAFTPKSDPVHKITIIPRGTGALGYTMHLPEDDTYLSSEAKLIASVDGLLGGRAAEEIIFNEVSTGAASDIQRATDIIRRMITVYGMSERFKNMTLGKAGQGYGSDGPELVREYSEATQQYIDEEIARVMAERYNHVLKLLTEHKVLLDYIANRLLEKETMEAKEFNDIINAENHCKELEYSDSKDSNDENNEVKDSSSDTE